MSTQIGCVVCGSLRCQVIAQSGGNITFECDVCGQYKVSSSVLSTTLNPSADRLSPIQRAVLSHRIRQSNDGGREPPLLTTYEVDDVVANGGLPSPAQQATNIVRYFGDRVAPSGQPVDEVSTDFHATVGSPNRDFAMR